MTIHPIDQDIEAMARRALRHFRQKQELPTGTAYFLDLLSGLLGRCDQLRQANEALSAQVLQLTKHIEDKER